jgi:hypothetical protein
MTDLSVQSKPAPEPVQTRSRRQVVGRIRVYQHSDLLYWWAVWAYGYFCALVTALGGVRIQLKEASLLVYPRAWLGFSFVVLVLFVLVFTHVRARGIKSLVLFLVVISTGFFIEKVYGLDELLKLFPALLIHMNLSFYLTFSTLLLLIWLITTFGTDRLTYWHFAPREVGKKIRLTEGGEKFFVQEVRTARHSDDIFVHRLLGLWFLGFGTGDLDISFTTPGGEKHYELKNVWRIGHVAEEINRLVRSEQVIARHVE